MAMTKRHDHANEERYGAAIEALDAAGKTSSAEALAAATGIKRTKFDQERLCPDRNALLSFSANRAVDAA